jgi:hypothetical protein
LRVYGESAFTREIYQTALLGLGINQQTMLIRFGSLSQQPLLTDDDDGAKRRKLVDFLIAVGRCDRRHRSLQVPDLSDGRSNGRRE